MGMRGQVVKSALNAYDRIREKDERGEVPMYRPRNWNKEEREEEKKRKKSNWFRGKEGKNESVLFVPATPGGELKKKYQEVIGAAEVKIAVVEVPGTTMKRKLQKSDPFKKPKCEKEENCLVCSGSDRGRCRDEGVTYEVKCLECGGKYVGETSRNAFTRGTEHRTGIHRRDKESTLYNHCIEEHDGKIAKFQMKVTGRFKGDPMKRQITESINIEQEDHLLNRRDEWRQIKLPRITLRLE